MPTSSLGPVGVLRATLNSFWICRVSIFSVLAGWLLFYGAPQAQALFLDLRAPEIALRNWATFYGIVFFFWMLPTQLSARVMLHAGEERFEEGHTSWYITLMVHLPWLLALACLASVAAGQYWALDHIPDNTSPAQGTRSPLEEAAYAQVARLIWTTVAFIAAWLLAWMAVRPLLNRLALVRGLLENPLFRVVAMAMFGHRAGAHTHVADATAAPVDSFDERARQLQTAWAAISLFLIWLAGLYFVYLSPLAVEPALQRAPMFAILVGSWIPVLTFFAYAANRSRLPLLAAAILALTLVADRLPGLHEARTLTASALSGASPPPQLQSRQPTLREAITLWRKANGCAPEPDRANPCLVRPIIVAAEGGGSRAAFYTASILAHLDDLSDPGSYGATGTPVFSRQLFAISAVSGSSLGAGIFAAVREELRNAPLPRYAEVEADALWFKSGEALGTSGGEAVPPAPTGTRKDVVQMIAAGDFLTPAAAALGLDIWVPFLARFSGGDRTFFLERAWEERYALVFSASTDPGSREGLGLARPFSSLAPDAETWRPLLLFNATSVTTGRRIITATLDPLTDRRISNAGGVPFEPVFSDAYDTYDLMCRASAQMPAAAGTCTCTERGDGHGLAEPRIKGCDVRLSTAVSHSARFPIISSAGEIKGRDGEIADRVVDGSYFDYSGIVSALELRLQMARIDRSLNPLVLFLTNDPGFDPQACAGTGGGATDELEVLRRPPVAPEPAEWRLFSMLRYPLDTVFSSRVARSVQTTGQSSLLNRYERIAQIQTQAQAPASMPTQFREWFGRRQGFNFDVVSVGARCSARRQVRPVPMNWWLAMPTQHYLDEQLCAPNNHNTFSRVLAQLWPDGAQQPLGEQEAERRLRTYCGGPAGVAVRGVQAR